MCQPLTISAVLPKVYHIFPGKEVLKERQEKGEVPALSLLSELLKGAVANQTSSQSSSNTEGEPEEGSST